MITLEVTFHYNTHRFFFETMGEAEYVLNELEKEMKVRTYNRLKVNTYNRLKEEGRTFRFNDACGPCVVVIERIDNARIIDYKEHFRVTKEHEDTNFQYRLDREVEARKQMKANGLLLSNDNSPVIVDSDVGLK